MGTHVCYDVLLLLRVCVVHVCVDLVCLRCRYVRNVSGELYVCVHKCGVCVMLLVRSAGVCVVHVRWECGHILYLVRCALTLCLHHFRGRFFKPG